MEEPANNSTNRRLKPGKYVSRPESNPGNIKSSSGLSAHHFWRSFMAEPETQITTASDAELSKSQMKHSTIPPPTKPVTCSTGRNQNPINESSKS